MVERPIKKSERQTIAISSGGVEEAHSAASSPIEDTLEVITPVEKPSTTRPVRRQDKTKGKGKGNQQEDALVPAKPALVRGPKPKKFQPPVIETDSEDDHEDSATELSQQTATEG